MEKIRNHLNPEYRCQTPETVLQDMITEGRTYARNRDAVYNRFSVKRQVATDNILFLVLSKRICEKSFNGTLGFCVVKDPCRIQENNKT